MIIVKEDNEYAMVSQIIPSLSNFRKQDQGVINKTPEHGRWPLIRGDLIMAFELPDDKKVDAHVTFLSEKGNPTVPESVPDWLTDNTDLLALTPSADGLTCTISAIGPLGTATVAVKATLAEGGSVAGSVDIKVIASSAVTV